MSNQLGASGMASTKQVQAAKARFRKGGAISGHAYEDRTRPELYEIAKKKNIAGRSKMGKWDLIKAIRKAS